MKKIFLRIIKILCIMLALAITFGLLQEFALCHADHNRQRIKGFYREQTDSLDVVLLGASEVYSDFAPGYAYSYSGITSYLFATQADSILNYKSQLKNILQRQPNALIVVELNGAVYGDEEETVKEANLRNYADNVPFDAVKLEWVSQRSITNKAEYLIPILKYHSVWSDFPNEMKYQKTIWQDRMRGYNYLKGILNETVVFQNPQRSLNSHLPQLAESKKTLTQTEETGLRELLEYCREQQLKNVVFTRFPHIVVKRTYDRFERSNTVGDIVAEYGFDYLNFERDFAQTGLDETKDFYNLDHLNVRGQQKFTAFLTDYLTTRYAVAPHPLDEKLRSEWDACADYYSAYVRYSESLLSQGERKELSEDCELIDQLGLFLPGK